MKIKKFLAVAFAAAVAFTAAAPVSVAQAATEYHAYIGIQTPVFSFRNAWSDSMYGKETDYFNQVTGWEGSDAVTRPGTFTDATITGDGTYTVSVDGLDFGADEFASQDYMNLIFVSTDIPRDAVEISNVVLDVDGSQPSISPLISPEDDDRYTTIAIQNIWNEEIKTIGYYKTPMSSIKVTFTVSGLGEASSETTDSAADTSSDDSATTSDTGSSDAGTANATVAQTADVTPVAGIVLAILGVSLVVVAIRKRSALQ